MPESTLYKQLVKKFIEHDVVVASNIIEGLEDKQTSELLESRTRLKEHITGAIKEQIRELLQYPEGSVSRVVTTDFMLFDKQVLAKDAVSKIRSLSRKRRPASYAYVVDEQKHLLGELNMLDLMIAQPAQTLESIMIKDVFSMHGFLNIQEAAADLARRKYFAAPVVDSENRIIGIIKAERLIKGVQEDTTKGLQQMFGAGLAGLTALMMAIGQLLGGNQGMLIAFFFVRPSVTCHIMPHATETQLSRLRMERRCPRCLSD